MCYTDIVYVPLFNLWYIRAFKLNKPLHKFISPTFTWARLILLIGPYKFIILFFPKVLTSLSCYSSRKPLQVYHGILLTGPYNFITLFFPQALTSLSRYFFAGPYMFITLFFPQTLTGSSRCTPHRPLQIFHVILPKGPYKFFKFFFAQALTSLSCYKSHELLTVFM
jgi:hypothetical protein